MTNIEALNPKNENGNRQYTSIDHLLTYSDEELRRYLKSVDLNRNSDSIRGIVYLEEDTTVFVKRGHTAFTRQHLAQEIAAYDALRATGFTRIPRLIAADPEHATIITEDLSECDFSDQWDATKLAAAFQAIEDLAAQPTDSFQRFTIDNGWRDMAKDSSLIETLRQKMGDAFDEKIVQELDIRAQTVDGFLAAPGVVSHGDVRGDNFAYDAKAGTGMFVDWSWCGVAPPSKDPTELLVSVAENGFPVDHDTLAHYCSAEACLMLAGYWFSQCTRKPWHGGEHVRDHQYVSARIAWEWYQALR